MSSRDAIEAALALLGQAASILQRAGLEDRGDLAKVLKAFGANDVDGIGDASLHIHAVMLEKKGRVLTESADDLAYIAMRVRDAIN